MVHYRHGMRICFGEKVPNTCVKISARYGAKLIYVAAYAE